MPMFAGAARLSQTLMPWKTSGSGTESLKPRAYVKSLDLKKQEDFIATEEKYGAHNYHPLPVVLERGEGVFMWDTDGKRYFDFLSAYSAVNQGHCHPKILAALTEQAKTLCLTSRAFHNNVYGPYAKFVTEFFGYDKVLPMNTGVEGVETAVKIMKKWAYTKKGIPENEGIIVFADENFHGRTLLCCSVSTDPDTFKDFGPVSPGFTNVAYNDVPAFEKLAEKYGDKIIGFVVEPIQGEAGIIVPAPDYLPKIKKILREKCGGALMCADEVQTGIGRTGTLLCSVNEKLRPGFWPDMVVLGKALSGGIYPVSAVLCGHHIMDCIQPGQHGSTYGGNPIGCAVAMAACNVLKDEKLCENAETLGELFRSTLKAELKDVPFVKEVRGQGLLNAVECDPEFAKQVSAWQVCLKLKENGLLAKPTHANIIRFAPPLVITEKQLKECMKIIVDTMKSFDVKKESPRESKL